MAQRTVVRLVEQGMLVDGYNTFFLSLLSWDALRKMMHFVG
jgi:hypothetical protein